MPKLPLDFKIHAEKLVPFLSTIMNVHETHIMLAMQLRKDLFSTKDMIDLNNPTEIEKLVSKFGSVKRVRIAIKTLKNMGLIIERIDPKTGYHALVRNRSSQDTIHLIQRLSRNMTETVKSYLINPSDWPDFHIITGNYLSKKDVAERLRQKKANKRNKTV